MVFLSTYKWTFMVMNLFSNHANNSIDVIIFSYNHLQFDNILLTTFISQSYRAKIRL